MSAASHDAQIAELLSVSQRLLDAIAAGDWNAYAALCDADITCFEPEARGELVSGLAFHKYYFDLGGAASRRNTTICGPRIHLQGELAVVCYVRLTQSLDASGHPKTARSEETRVWRHTAGGWRHVHFHRSCND